MSMMATEAAEMPLEAYVGRRLSYSSNLCTVRYVGQVKGTRGQWLGVEWDDPNRGKHAGVHEGVKYFDCRSSVPTAGSFVRPSRPADPPLSFSESLRKKYASDARSSDGEGTAAANAIEISGKIVEEVGFEKVRRQLAALHELRIVLLDGLCMGGVLACPRSAASDAAWLREIEEIGKTCPKIVELDLSRNLIEQWEDVAGICTALVFLRSLKVNGNKFRELCMPLPRGDQARTPFSGLKDLGLDETLLSWTDIASLCSHIPSLTSLSASSNNLVNLMIPLQTTTLTDITLENNAFTTLSALSPLSSLPHLQSLRLRNNLISSIHRPGSVPHRPLSFPPSLSTLDLSCNAISTWAFISALPPTFPGLLSLRTSSNPLSTNLPPSTASMLTLSRLPTLLTLNYSPITPAERTNAELYYLSTIASALARVPPHHESQITAQHPRYPELCALHGEPNITRTAPDAVGARTLAARLIDFTFVLCTSAPGSDGGDDTTALVESKKQVPRGFDVYRLKGVVGRLFSLPPMGLRLVWETGEWDPVGGGEDGGEWSCSEDEGLVPRTGGVLCRDGGWGSGEVRGVGREGYGWVEREVELVDGTREVGFWIEGRAARVRVELR
ncbi:MAG: hypothetical protein FRX48_05050 [Lasallia pustulata]|uniref:CAP-Gly domain-containing protein n=1 Tax=Lasallia pustulata TaxID=136370 RepID=A0A5M8PP85_9LECA|nr:MAG: hypothetical protein FRX48_05050 [Lasallia pustulata]